MRFFGSRGETIDYNERWKTRVGQLSHKEKRAMDTFMERKMAESKRRILIDWDPEKAKSYLEEVLFGDHAENLKDIRVDLEQY